MSHVVGVKLEVSDLDILEAVCKSLGAQLMRGQKTHGWYGRWVNDYSQDDAAYQQGIQKPEDYGKCDHAIKVPGTDWEVGLVKSKTGLGYAMVYDNYGQNGRAIEKCLGKKLQHLNEGYVRQVTTKKLKRKGFRMKERRNTAGELQLVAYK